jgi:dTMP kinase
MNQTFSNDPLTNKSPTTERLIVIDGLKGVGVTTQVRRLESILLDHGIPVRVCSLASCGEISEDVNKLFTKGATKSVGARTISLLALSNVIELIEKSILPNLMAGFTVLCDRYYYSLYVQSLLMGANPDWLHSLFSIAIKPSQTIILDAPPEIITKRIVLQYGGLIRQEELTGSQCYNLLQNSQLSPYNNIIYNYLQMRTLLSEHIDEMNLTVVDATDDTERLTAKIKELIVPFLLTT